MRLGRTAAALLVAAALLAALVAVRTRNVAATLAAGMVVLWLLEAA